jgi:DNA-nicking Smr family endonuclease
MGKSSGKKRQRGRSGQEISADDLKKVFADQLEAQAQAREQEKQARAEAQRLARERAREANLLADEFGDVTPLPADNRVVPDLPAALPVPRQRDIDEQEALAASLSDDIDLAMYLESDDALSYTANGVGPDVVGRLRRGAWSVSAQIDLHGFRRDEAREELVSFLDDCRASTKRCVRVIHGKGLGSVNREPVLKDKVRRWLVQRKDVLAFCETAPNDGGSGALLVLLAGR